MASDLARLLQDYFYFGKLESEISAAAIIIAGALFAGVIVYLVFRRYLSHWAKGTKTKIDDKILKNVRAPIIFLFLLSGHTPHIFHLLIFCVESIYSLLYFL